MGTVLGSRVKHPAWPPQSADGHEVVFAEPWEARAFAITVVLHDRGLYSWTEWTQALAARIKTAPRPGDGGTYYHHWLGALEDLLALKGIGSDETARWREAWRRAANRTPHGKPIELQAHDFDATPENDAHRH